MPDKEMAVTDNASHNRLLYVCMHKTTRSFFIQLLCFCLLIDGYCPDNVTSKLVDDSSSSSTEDNVILAIIVMTEILTKWRQCN